MKLREWATPLTIGAFVVMGVTGALMFFHLDAAFNKPVHEWVGLVLVAAVVAHLLANWLSFKRYFLTTGLGRAVIALGVLVLAFSFVPFGGAGEGGSPPALAIGAIARAPIASVAPLTGRPVETVLADLEKAGVKLPDAQASLESVVKGNRELQGRAIRALFASN